MKAKKVKMKFRGSTSTHIINPIVSGGEYSLCGMQCVEDDDMCEMEFLGETEGKATCSECINIVKYCKAL